MWIFTPRGFLSAVQVRNNPKMLMVRFRSRPHATWFRNSIRSSIASPTTIKSTPLADYPYRVVVAKDVFAAWLAKQVMCVDYDNFKGATAQLGPCDARYQEAQHEVWAVLRNKKIGYR